MARTPKQILSKYGFEKDSLKTVHDWAIKCLQDELLPPEVKRDCAKVLISLAKEILEFERKAAPPAGAKRPARPRPPSKLSISTADEVIKRGSDLKVFKLASNE